VEGSRGERGRCVTPELRRSLSEWERACDPGGPRAPIRTWRDVLMDVALERPGPRSMIPLTGVRRMLAAGVLVLALAVTVAVVVRGG